MRVTLRPATLDDAHHLFEWRNDELTRRMSHSTEAVSWDEHLAWLGSSLSNPRRQLFIAELGGEQVGTCRADHEDGETEISWTVAPAHRGRGIGGAMVRSLVELLPGVVRAEVKASNVASQRIADAAGLTLDEKREGVLHYRRRPRHHADQLPEAT